MEAEARRFEEALYGVCRREELASHRGRALKKDRISKFGMEDWVLCEWNRILDCLGAQGWLGNAEWSCRDYGMRSRCAVGASVLLMMLRIYFPCV